MAFLGTRRRGVDHLTGMSKITLLTVGSLDGLANAVSECLPEAEILVASDGQMGMALAARKAPHVILLADSPGFDVFETCRECKSHQQLRHTPVIFATTAATDRDVRVRALECGAEAFVPETADSLEIAALIRTMAKIKETNEAGRKDSDGDERFHFDDEIYRQLFEAETDAIFLIDNLTGQILQANGAAAERYGYTIEELLRMKNTDLSAEPERTSRATRSSAPGPFYAPSRLHRKKDGTVFPVEITGRFFTLGDRSVHMAAIRDIGDRMRTEDALRESELRYHLLAENISDVIWILDLTTERFRYVSPSVEQLRGYTPAEAMEQDLAEALTPESEAHFRSCLPERIRQFEKGVRQVYTDEIAQPCKDGTTVWTEVKSYGCRNKATGRIEVNGVSRNITDRKRHEQEREATIRILGPLNSANDLHGLIRELTGVLQDWSGCQAVGIRLREGEDFPYFETRGFPAEFVQAENHLCARDAGGNPRLDSAGNPFLECMCGNVLCGRFDPRRPFFTENGSFWTNSTSQLLAKTTEAERQSRTRNRCNGEGYESVALIPLRIGSRTIGLLQFNDRRTGDSRLRGSRCWNGQRRASPSPSSSGRRCGH